MSWQRGFAEEQKTGREGTSGEELDGDPNRVPKKGDQDKEGEGAMKVSLQYSTNSANAQGEWLWEKLL